DEADMVAKVRTAMGCTPMVSALFANSPLSSGAENGFVTKRLAIWQDTDPDRCGLLPFVFESGFGYARYTDWALDVPMFFLIRDGEYLPARGLSFRRFMEKGMEGHRARLSDWDMHLTTLFPEVRLKQIIEVRGADAVPRELTCALPAIWKGLLYDAEALAEAWELVSSFSFEERVQAQHSVARKGLGGELGGRPVKILAEKLLEISSAGLDRIATRQGISGGEQNFIAPLRRILESGKSPGEVILDRWQNEWNGSLERLISYARY
ncbi:MAG: glutamate-cysteine ligase family protein, partial [Myxococcota bacterium]|nr:glutamate-cysteine ligase family protein [Myxococcota bacterium]